MSLMADCRIKEEICFYCPVMFYLSWICSSVCMASAWIIMSSLACCGVIDGNSTVINQKDACLNQRDLWTECQALNLSSWCMLHNNWPVSPADRDRSCVVEESASFSPPTVLAMFYWSCVWAFSRGYLAKDVCYAVDVSICSIVMDWWKAADICLKAHWQSYYN